MRERTLSCLPIMLAFVAAVWTATPAAATDSAWQPLTSEDKAVSAELPGAPKYTAVRLLSGQGYPYTMHQYAFERGGATFQVQTAQYPKDVNVFQPQANIQVGLDSAARSLEGGKWATVGWTRHQGFTAADAVGIRSGHAVRVFSVLKGARLVTLTYVGPPDSARSADVERFLKSLKLL